MKLKDRLKELKILWPPQKGITERIPGKPELKPEQLLAGKIVKAVETRDRCGVLFTLSHPDWKDQVTATLVVPDELTNAKGRAADLVKIAQGFVGKTVKELGEVDVLAGTEGFRV